MLLLTLIAVFDSKNGELLKKLIDYHGDKLYSIAYSYMKNHHDAKDVVQEVFISAYKTIENFYDLEREESAALLVKYTRNKAIDHLRKKKRRLEIPLTYKDEGEEKFYDVPDMSYSPEHKLLEKESLERIASYVDELSDPQREVLEMKYKYGMSEKDIAEALSISETAVSSRINRAKNALAKKLKGEEL